MLRAIMLCTSSALRQFDTYSSRKPFIRYVINRCVLSINKWIRINTSAEHDNSISVHVKVHCMLNSMFHGMYPVKCVFLLLRG